MAKPTKPSAPGGTDPASAERTTPTPANKRHLSLSAKQTARVRQFLRVLSGVGLLAFFALGLWAFQQGYLTDREKLAALMERAGSWAPALFLLLQVIQCVIPIIPGGVTLLMGVFLFGPWMGFLYNYLGILLGSTAGFFLARFYGTHLVRALVSESSYQKYIGWLDRNQKKFDVFFAAAMLFPFMPDDLICMVAGLSKMKVPRFLVILAIAKIPSILVYTLFLDTAFEQLLRFFG